MSEDTKKTKGRVYRLNPPCPYCGEEHMWWNTRLTDEEQEQMDLFAEKCKEMHPFWVLLGEPGIVIKRRLKCGLCNKEFDVNYGLYPQNEYGWHHPDFVEVGVYPVDP